MGLNEQMKMILLILITVSCLACNKAKMLMYGLGGFIGGSIILNYASNDDDEVYNEGYKYGSSIASMANPETKFIEYHPDKDNEDPRFVKGYMDGFNETMRKRNPDKKKK